LNILDDIIASKRLRLNFEDYDWQLAEVQRTAPIARKLRTPRAFRNSLAAHAPVAIIAEIKRRSPSKGPIRPDLVPEGIGVSFTNAGAAAISVLTEEDFFGGSLMDMRAVRHGSDIPILRKDFIIDEFQVFESAAYGADALLLIVAALDTVTLRQLLVFTEALGMDALVEVHNESELERALSVGASLIGVNNRDLTTFEVSLDVGLRLAKLAPLDCLLVAESGISNADDIRRLRDAGYRGFLIGEAFMKAEDPGEALRELLVETSR
jgi:indole-3-glycerol phosphate synthase